MKSLKSSILRSKAKTAPLSVIFIYLGLLALYSCADDATMDRNDNYANLSGLYVCNDPQSSHLLNLPSEIFNFRFVLSEPYANSPRPQDFFSLQVFGNDASSKSSPLFATIYPMTVTNASKADVSSDRLIPSCQNKMGVTALSLTLPQGIQVSPGTQYRVAWKGPTAAQPNLPGLTSRDDSQRKLLSDPSNFIPFTAGPIAPSPANQSEAFLTFDHADFLRILSVSLREQLVDNTSPQAADIFNMMSVNQMPSRFTIMASEEFNAQTATNPGGILIGSGLFAFDARQPIPEVLTQIQDRLKDKSQQVDAARWQEFLAAHQGLPVRLSSAARLTFSHQFQIEVLGSTEHILPYDRRSKSGKVMILVLSRFESTSSPAKQLEEDLFIGGFVVEPARAP